MPMTLDSRDLRAVLETARTGSVTRAADRLHVTQSAVSHQLRALEGRLGTPLFLRTGRRMLPTPAGLELVRAAERVLGELTRAEALVARLVRQQAGELRVATQCHTGYHWLPPLLKSARARFPHHTVRILAEHTAHPIAALLDGRLDLAIVNDLPRDSRLRVRPLFEDEHAAIVWPGHPWTRRAWVSPTELGGVPLLLVLARARRQLHRAHGAAAGRRHAGADHVHPAHRGPARDGEGRGRRERPADVVGGTGPRRR